MTFTDRELEAIYMVMSGSLFCSSSVCRARYYLDEIKSILNKIETMRTEKIRFEEE